LFDFQGRNKGKENPRKRQTNQGKFKEAISSQNASIMPVTEEVARTHIPFIFPLSHFFWYILLTRNYESTLRHGDGYGLFASAGEICGGFDFQLLVNCL